MPACRVSLGPSLWECCGPRASMPVPWEGEWDGEWGASCTPGVSPTKPPPPRRRLQMRWEHQPECGWVGCGPSGPGEAASASQSRCPGSHLTLWSKPGQDPGRDPRVRPGGLPGQGTSFQLLAQRNAQDAQFRPGICATEKPSSTVKHHIASDHHLTCPMGLGRRLNGVWALCKGDHCS